MLKLLSLFSGIGAFEKALENIDEPFEVIRYCEIDKYASKAYSLIHNLDENMNLKDVTTVDTAELPDDIDIITYGFPCQDISNAGKQKGFTDEDGSLTRSGLFFEALRIIEDTQPKIAIAENVKALVSKKFTAEFKIVLDCLNDAGYKNYWAVLNAKDFGVPQNRERVFIISIREDIDHGFKFPEKYELKLRLKDLLEETVDEKYYLSDKMIQGFLKHNDNHEEKGTGFIWKPKDRNGNDIANCLRANGALCATDNCIDETAKVKQIGNLFPSEKRKNPNQGRLYNSNGLCPTLSAMQGGQRQPYVIEEPNKDIKPELVGGIGEKKSNGGTQFYQQDRVYSSEAIAMAHPAQIPGGSYKYTVDDTHQMTIDEFLPIKEAKIITVGNYSPSNHNASRVVDGEGIAPTVMENHGTVTAIVDSLPIKEATKKGYKEAYDGDYVNLQYPNSETRRGRVGDQMAQTLLCTDENAVVSGLRIRKLTPKECFRLMGFDDKDCDILVENKISNTQIYKMAGNSIVVDVLEEIFVELLNQYEDVFPL